MAAMQTVKSRLRHISWNISSILMIFEAITTKQTTTSWFINISPLQYVKFKVKIQYQGHSMT